MPCPVHGAAIDERLVSVSSLHGVLSLVASFCSCETDVLPPPVRSTVFVFLARVRCTCTSSTSTRPQALPAQQTGSVKRKGRCVLVGRVPMNQRSSVWYLSVHGRRASMPAAAGVHTLPSGGTAPGPRGHPPGPFRLLISFTWCAALSIARTDDRPQLPTAFVPRAFLRSCAAGFFGRRRGVMVPLRKRAPSRQRSDQFLGGRPRAEPVADPIHGTNALFVADV